MKAAIQNTKKRFTQVSIIKEKHSRYIPSTNQVWEEKEKGSNDESSFSKHKIKETHVSIIKKNIQGTQHPLITFGRKKKRGVMIETAFKTQNKKTQVSIIKEKHSRYIPSTNQGWEEKEKGSNDESSYSKHKIKETHVSIIKKNIQGTHQPLMRCGRRKKRGVMMKAAIQNTK